MRAQERKQQERALESLGDVPTQLLIDEQEEEDERQGLMEKEQQEDLRESLPLLPYLITRSLTRLPSPPAAQDSLSLPCPPCPSCTSAASLLLLPDGSFSCAHCTCSLPPEAVHRFAECWRIEDDHDLSMPSVSFSCSLYPLQLLLILMLERPRLKLHRPLLSLPVPEIGWGLTMICSSSGCDWCLDVSS